MTIPDQSSSCTGVSKGLTLRKVQLSLDGHPLFRPLDLEVLPGHVVTLMGPSGCGKSSLLAFLCGTLQRSFQASGSVLLDGRAVTDLPPERRHMGILFQDDLLFPHLSVAENLAFGLPPAIKGQAARMRQIDSALDAADMVGFGSRDPATLSGGQRARIALLRTLISQPKALLLDEPFSKLDVALRDRFRAFVFRHAKAQNLPTLLVTHDPMDAAASGGQIYEMNSSETEGEASSEHNNMGEAARNGPDNRDAGSTQNYRIGGFSLKNP